MASMDAETTKYLGGDVEHTHLVKGLDYALLVKIREEERQQQVEVRAREASRLASVRGWTRAQPRNFSGSTMERNAYLFTSSVV